jgi:hypothetical protein
MSDSMRVLTQINEYGSRRGLLADKVMEKRLTTILFLFILFKDKDYEGLMGERDEYTIGDHTFTLPHPLKILFHVFQPGAKWNCPLNFLINRKVSL